MVTSTGGRVVVVAGRVVVVLGGEVVVGLCVEEEAEPVPALEQAARTSEEATSKPKAGLAKMRRRAIRKG
jgi:hypothetical protein